MRFFFPLGRTVSVASAKKAALLLCGLGAIGAGQVAAASFPGEQLKFIWTDTAGPDAGLSGSALVILGSASTATSFNIASFDVVQNGAGFCGPCNSLTEDVSAISFNAVTNGLIGHITGTYLGGNGNTSYDLAIQDVSNGIGPWSLAFTAKGVTQTDTGTYLPLVQVDEPSIALLISAAIGGLALLRRRFPVPPGATG